MYQKYTSINPGAGLTNQLFLLIALMKTLIFCQDKKSRFVIMLTSIPELQHASIFEQDPVKRTEAILLYNKLKDAVDTADKFKSGYPLHVECCIQSYSGSEK